MFTGIIEHTGTVRSLMKQSHGIRMEIHPDHPLSLERGGSIAINGVCLTVTDLTDSSFFVDVVQDTLGRTNLCYLRRGTRVNVELPLAIGDRLDGHILEGHVDGMGTIVSVRKEGIQTILRIKLPDGLGRYVIENGSIGIDGVSLTVKKKSQNIITITLVPFTVERTTFTKRQTGAWVNIEVDRIGKYLEQQLNNRGRL